MTSETLVNFYQTARCCNPEDSHLRTHCRENLKSNINIAWIVYQKAFDSFLHSWIEKSELIGVNNKIVKFCKLSVEKWGTELQLKTNQELMKSRPTKLSSKQSNISG
jgi:hypothetical protein